MSRNFVIDTDLHNALKSNDDLLPYLPKVWHEQWLSFGVGAMHPYYTPVGVMRRDASGSGEPPGSDPAFVKEHLLDKHNIKYAVLTGSGMLGVSVLPDPDYANAVSSAYNDWVVETWCRFSPQYKGSILINHTDPVYAAKEIDRMAGHPDMVQVLMASGSRSLFGQRFYHPIYEAAERNGLPVAIHPGDEGVGIASPPTTAGFSTRYMEWHNTLPISFMSHLNSIICEGVFEKFPGLKVVVVEGGIAWLPHLMWRMDKNYKALRSSAPWLKRSPSEYINDHVRLTTQPIEEPDDPRQLSFIFEIIDAGKTIMFSSDYPHWDFDDPHMSLPPLPKEVKQRILYDNACELYKLGDPAGKEDA